MYRSLLSLLIVALLLTPASGQPRMWADDFTTVATYDYASWMAPCYGGPSTKYSVMEVFVASIADERALSGGGYISTTTVQTVGLIGRMPLVFIGVLNLGMGCPDTFGIPWSTGTEPFTSDDICYYGGLEFSPFQDKGGDAGNTYNIKGVDDKPGIVNVDDDADAETDEDDESPAAHWTTVNGGYGNRNGTGFWAGYDGAPGIAGEDDDANGTTDDWGETSWPGSDDGDDTTRQATWFIINANMITTSSIHLEMDLPPDHDQFNIRQFIDSQDSPIESSDEIPTGFYDANVRYNFAFCVSDTCYGAILWREADMSNPAETLGPLVNTQHVGPGDNMVAIGNHQDSSPAQYIRRNRVFGNGNFNNTFYIISGDAKNYFPPIDADFDDDHDVDGQDFMKFSACFNGSLRPPKTGCANPEANFDGDIDVDGQDFMAFSKCFNGSLRRPKCLPPILTSCPE